MRYRPFPHRRCLRPRRSSLRRRGVIRLGRHGLTVRRGPATSLTLEHRPDADQATLTGAPESPVSMRSAPKDKVRFFLDLFCCRSDVYALRWENRRDGRSGWMPAIRGYWRNGMNRADAPYLPLTPDVVGQHLRGEVHIGLYSLGDDDTCWWSRPPAAYPRDGRRFAATRAVTLADQNDHTPAISACTDAGDPQYAVDRRWMGRPELV